MIDARSGNPRQQVALDFDAQGQPVDAEIQSGEKAHFDYLAPDDILITVTLADGAPPQAIHYNPQTGEVTPALTVAVCHSAQPLPSAFTAAGAGRSAVVEGSVFFGCTYDSGSRLDPDSMHVQFWQGSQNMPPELMGYYPTEGMPVPISSLTKTEGGKWHYTVNPIQFDPATQDKLEAFAQQLNNDGVSTVCGAVAQFDCVVLAPIPEIGPPLFAICEAAAGACQWKELLDKVNSVKSWMASLNDSLTIQGTVGVDAWKYGTLQSRERPVSGLLGFDVDLHGFPPAACINRVEVTPASTNVDVNGTKPLTAKGFDALGQAIPTGSLPQSGWTWQSDQPSKVEVLPPSQGPNAMVKGKADGTATITASEAMSGKEGTGVVKVSGCPCANVFSSAWAHDCAAPTHPACVNFVPYPPYGHGELYLQCVYYGTYVSFQNSSPDYPEPSCGYGNVSWVYPITVTQADDCRQLILEEASVLGLSCVDQ